MRIGREAQRQPPLPPDLLTAHMHTDKSSHPTHLFTVRLWREELGHDRHEWRGQIQQVGTGEVRYFRDWQGIVACIEELLTESEGARRE